MKMAKTLHEVQVHESGRGVLDDNNNSETDSNHNDNPGNNKSVIIKSEVIPVDVSNTNNNNNSDSDNNNSSRTENQNLPNTNNECQIRKTPGGKYQLRPRSIPPRRRSSDSEWNFQETTTPIRHRSRPQPLSRYRRKTANARERYRMRQINTAFENLRGVLPSWVCSRRPASDMTKIATLKLASAYIKSLQDILDGKAHHDTCSWVLSAILKDSPNAKPTPHPPSSTQTANSDKCQTPVVNNSTTDSDLVSLLCGGCGDGEGPSDSMEFQDNLESLTYLTPLTESEAMALLLGGDTPSPWIDSPQVSLV